MQQQPQRGPPRKEVLLTDSEKQQFGNRCPEGYKKLRILGKGGIAVVWLGQRTKQNPNWIRGEIGGYVAMK
jgi:hypothetical protein